MTNDRGAHREFDYGWCYADYREPGVDKRDDGAEGLVYALGTRGAIADMFKTLGLPIPDEEEVYRGRQGDMVFLNSHNLVIKVLSKFDPLEFTNPGIAQPLGWLHDETTRVTMAIYPGLKLLARDPKFAAHYHKQQLKGKTRRGKQPKREEMSKLALMIDSAGNEPRDVRVAHNIGLIPALSSLGREELGLSLIDTDTRFNARSSLHRNQEPRPRADLHPSQQASAMHAILDQLLTELEEKRDVSDAFNLNDYRQMGRYHAPLRRAFSMMFTGGDGQALDKPDSKRLDNFWQMAKNFASEGYGIYATMGSSHFAYPDEQEKRGLAKLFDGLFARWHFEDVRKPMQVRKTHKDWRQYEEVIGPKGKKR